MYVQAITSNYLWRALGTLALRESKRIKTRAMSKTKNVPEAADANDKVSWRQAAGK